MRIVSWNIRAGGGSRIAAIADAILGWKPDVVALSEFRGSPPSTSLLANLRDAGFPATVSAALPRTPNANCLALASRVPIRRYFAHRTPAEPGRWLAVEVQSSRPVTLGVVHIPNEVTRRKWPYMDAVSGLARAWRHRQALIVGDTNSGRPVFDEESPVFGPRYPPGSMPSRQLVGATPSAISTPSSGSTRGIRPTAAMAFASTRRSSRGRLRGA